LNLVTQSNHEKFKALRTAKLAHHELRSPPIAQEPPRPEARNAIVGGTAHQKQKTKKSITEKLMKKSATKYRN